MELIIQSRIPYKEFTKTHISILTVYFPRNIVEGFHDSLLLNTQTTHTCTFNYQPFGNIVLLTDVTKERWRWKREIQLHAVSLCMSILTRWCQKWFYFLGVVCFLHKNKWFDLYYFANVATFYKVWLNLLQKLRLA